MSYANLEIERTGAVATVWLNRPQVRNALDEVLIADITRAFGELQDEDKVRVIVLGARGSAFCAGADLNWMKRMAGYGAQENHADAMRLAEMLQTVATCAKPVIARVHGPAFAGGMGLAAACDLRVADSAAEFCLTEVRIGLVPATICPYVIRALGPQAAKRYMLTADRLNAQEAWRIGFVDELAETGYLDETLNRLAVSLAAGGPNALSLTKRLIERVGMHETDDDLLRETATCIADVRASSEGREGVTSFLEKRKPSWTAS